MDMEIKPLDKETYAGQRFTARYQTDGYYNIRAVDFGFRVEYVAFEAPAERSFEDVFFSEWLDNPVAYGAFQDDRLLGYAEGALEKWNNRFRISNICIFDPAARHQGIGTSLMEMMINEAKDSGARMVVLETQSCNEHAIVFYQKNGFEIIGFDLYSYSNTGPERHEIRIEMGKRLV